MLSACTDPMANQPRYEPLEESTFFADRRASRHPPSGTVARGQLEFERWGSNAPVDEETGFPLEITMELMRRGRERFDIYCAVCHGGLGDGQGIVPARGFTTPPSFHSDRLREAEPVHFVRVIEMGFGRMPPYRKVVEPRDRWAIAAYIRALQLSRHAPLAELPEADRERIETLDQGLTREDAQ